MVILSRILTKDSSIYESIYFGNYDDFVATENAIYFAHNKWLQNSEEELVEETVLMHWDIPKGGQLVPIARGKLEGSLLNSFAMDAHLGYLRIALHKRNDEKTVNNVVILQTRDRLLREVGRSPDLAPGEEIKSVRFVGDVGYVVTFRLVDPLFILD
jgi:uncharacterized secreted protein with C-terminal beta-propeller domain